MGRIVSRELLATFGLDPSKKIKALSKGMRAQAGYPPSENLP